MRARGTATSVFPNVSVSARWRCPRQRPTIGVPTSSSELALRAVKRGAHGVVFSPTLQRWNQRSAPRRPRQPSSNQSRDFARVDSRALHHRQLVHIHQQPLQKWAFLDRFLAGLHDATLCRLSRKAERSGRLQRMLESPSRRLNRCTFGFASDKPAACYGNALPHNGKLTVPSLQLRAFKIKTEIRKYEDSSRSSRRSIRESISWDRSVE
jgi:hypothetical protein